MTWKKSISLEVAQIIFEPAATIRQDDLGFYEGAIHSAKGFEPATIRSKTLTGLCKSLVEELANQSLRVCR